MSVYLIIGPLCSPPHSPPTLLNTFCQETIPGLLPLSLLGNYQMPSVLLSLKLPLLVWAQYSIALALIFSTLLPHTNLENKNQSSALV